jgi:hypothetical protein
LTYRAQNNVDTVLSKTKKGRMKTIIVSPKEGITVKHPASGNPILPKTEIALSPQVKRYMRDGDLIEVQPKPKKKAKPQTESK